MKRILRVFPKQNSYTPTDNMVMFGLPPTKILIPEHDEVHISCVFSWDKQHCRDLQYQWQGVTDKPVLLGGVAFGSSVIGFKQGMYIKSNIIFTTRGCNNNCPWCIVPKLEGRLKELDPICTGNIIQDNNFTQASKSHQQKVFQMLKNQRAVAFKGGLECSQITDEFALDLAGLRIAEIWIACDTDGAMKGFKKAMAILKRHGFNQHKIYCFALCGDDMNKNEARLREIYHEGAMPFAQLYQPVGEENKKIYSRDWKNFQHTWSRPAAIRAHMERGTTYLDRNENSVKRVVLKNQESIFDK